MRDNLKIIIFDMDGVVIDSEPLHENARQMMFKKRNIVPDETFPKPVGAPAAEFWGKVMELCGIEGNPYDYEDEQYSLVAQQIEENHVQPEDGFWDVIHWARENGLKVGLASTSTRTLIDNTLRLLGVKEAFDYTISANDIKRKKPAPDPYLKVLEMAGFAPEEAVAVEDSTPGVQSAKNAEIYCYGYANPKAVVQDVSLADKVIASLKEIIE